MKSSTKTDPKPIRDIAYYEQRFRNRVFAKLISFVTEEARKQGLTKKDIAQRIRKDPASVTRLLSNPSNLTLDTISDLLLAFDAEAEPPEIVLFKDRRPPNYVHPLIVKTLGIVASDSPNQATTRSANDAQKNIVMSGQDLKFRASATVG